MPPGPSTLLGRYGQRLFDQPSCHPAHDADRHGMNIRDTRCLLLNAENASMAISRMGEYFPLASTLPAPAATAVLRYLSGTASSLPPVLDKMDEGLRRSFSEYDAVEDSGKDPSDSVLATSDHLERAKTLATELARELQAASDALSGQHLQPKQVPQKKDSSEAANLFYATHGGTNMSANDRVTHSRLRRGKFGTTPQQPSDDTRHQR